MSFARIILFDLDGTLIDTAPDLAGAMNAVLTRHGRGELPVGEVRHLVGEGARKLLARGWEETGRPASEDELDYLYDAFLEHYLENVALHSQPFDGFDEMLDELRGHGARFAICTNKPEAPTLRLLDELGLTDHFETVIGGDTLAHAKPHPMPLIEAINRLGGVAEEAVMIGDSITDIAAARAACLPVVALSHGYSTQPIAKLGADRLVDHLAEVPGAIASLFAQR